MPRRSKRLKNVPRPQKGKKRKSRKKSGKMMMSSSMLRPILDYRRLISDPCNGPLVRSVGHVHPGAVTERLRFTDSTFKDGASVVSSRANGYVVWFPSFHGQGAFAGGNSVAHANGCLYYFHNDAAGTAPINTSALPAGLSGSASDGASVTGLFLRDPTILQLATSGPFDRASCLSACLQLDYTGPLSAISGQVCVVQNYSLASFITNTNTPTSVLGFPTVDQIFSHAAMRERLHPQGAEVIWRPTDQSSIPRTSADNHRGSSIGPSTIADACFWTGSVGANPTRLAATNPNEIFGICIAWKGVPVGDLSFNFVKVVNLELAARNAQIEEIRTGEPPQLPTCNIDTVVNTLDLEQPGWQSSLTRNMGSMAASAGRALGGAIMNRVPGVIADAMPLLTNVYSGGRPYQARRGLRALMN